MKKKHFTPEQIAFLDALPTRGDRSRLSVLLATDVVFDYGPMPPPPFPLGIFGEVAVADICGDELDAKECARIRRLFSEANVSPSVTVNMFDTSGEPPDDSPALPTDRH